MVRLFCHVARIFDAADRGFPDFVGKTHDNDMIFAM